MSRRNRGRSRKYNKNEQIVDIEEARRERQRKREGQRGKKKDEPAHVVAEKKRAKKIKRRRALVYAVVIVLILAILGVTGYRIVSLKMEERALKKENIALQEKKEKLENELGNVNNPDYIEQQARKQLRMIMPGETLYVLPSEEELEEINKQNTEKEESEDEN